MGQHGVISTSCIPKKTLELSSAINYPSANQINPHDLNDEIKNVISNTQFQTASNYNENTQIGLGRKPAQLSGGFRGGGQGALAPAPAG